MAYLASMDGVIDAVATIVGDELTAARTRIADGRVKVQKYVETLEPDLREVGKEAEGKLDAEFDKLSSEVDNKQDALVDTLAQKYVESRNALDSRIEDLQAANKGLVDKALDAVTGVVKTILKLKDMLLNVLAKAASVIGDIISDPIGFLGRLVDGVKGGLSRFVDNIGSHLQEGLMGWLFGALGSAGITMPKSLDFAGILDLVLQILGLTYQNIRGRIAKVVGEPLVAKMEQTVDVIKDFATKGIAGAWEWIKDKISDLEDMVLGQIKEFITSKVIKAGITWIISLLNPAAAFIKACKAIYDIVMFIVERGSEIMEFVNSILDSIGAIAKGNIGVVVEKVEDALKRALPLAISFLASLLGLGGISEKIRSIIDAVRAPINKAIDFVVGGAVKTFKKMFGGAIGWAKGKFEKGKAYVKGKVEAGKAYVKGKVTALKDRFTTGGSKGKPKESAEEEPDPSKPVTTDFAMAGKQHTLTATADERGRVRLVMASASPGDLFAKAESALESARTSRKTAAATALEQFINSSRPKLTELARVERDQRETAREAAKQRVLREMAAELVAIGAAHGLSDLASYEALGLPEIELNRLVFDALIQSRTLVLQRRESRAEQPIQSGDPEEVAKRYDTLMQSTSASYARACAAELSPGGDARTFTGNVFPFAGAEYFVDHDAMYILPNEAVGSNRGALGRKVYVASKPRLASPAELKADLMRSLVAKFKYKGGRSIDTFRLDAEYLATGGPMETETGALFLAAMIAEPGRNLNAHVLNLLLMKQGGKESFFEAAPMTKGGTAAADKHRDPTLATLPGAGPTQPPIKVTEAEIKLVRDRYRTHHKGSDLEEMVSELGKDAVKRDLIDFLVQEAQL